MEQFNIKDMPEELLPNWLEKLAFISQTFRFTFMLVLGIIILPLAYTIMPDGGIAGFFLRWGFLWATFYLAVSYLDGVRKGYVQRIKAHIEDKIRQGLDKEK